VVEYQEEYQMEVTLSYIVVQCKCGYCGNVWEVEDDKAQNVDDAIDGVKDTQWCRGCMRHDVGRRRED